MILKTIHEELVQIKKELQAIRSSVEFAPIGRHIYESVEQTLLKKSEKEFDENKVDYIIKTGSIDSSMVLLPDTDISEKKFVMKETHQ